MSVDPDLVRELQATVGGLLTDDRQARARTGDPALSRAGELELGRSLIRKAIEDYNAGLVESGENPMPWADMTDLAKAVEARTFGAGRLQRLLDDPDIENIDINGCDEVFVTYAGGREESAEPVAQSDGELVEQIQILGSYAGLGSRAFDPANPELDLRLPDGSRLSAVMSLTERPVVSVRRHRIPLARLSDLLGTDTMTPEVAAFLSAAVKARLNIMVAGATNSGKTTLLRALVHELDPSERLITIERSLELGLRRDRDMHRNVAAFEERLPNAEGQGGVSMQALVRRSLRMNPSRVIVGEVLGDEVVAMLNAMTQGNDGSLSTIHAKSARNVIERLGTYAIQAAERLPFEVTARLISQGLDLIVFVRKDDAGDGTEHRAIREIGEVVGFADGQPVVNDVFLEDADGVASRHTQLSQEHRRVMEQTGWRDPVIGGGAWQ